MLGYKGNKTMILNKKLLLVYILTILFSTSLFSSNYSFRKYLHVEKFYSTIAQDTINVGLKHNLPPAAIMAMAGLESGYGRGYVAQITGNILSLGAFKGDYELPGLYLPYSKTSKKVLFDPNDIKKYTKNNLVWKKRPKSLKRDYRPTPYAGTTTNLELLKYDELLKDKAIKGCLNDFATRWIIKSSKVKVFRDAKIWLENEVLKYGSEILFKNSTNIKFIKMIGGHKHSFNYRDTWPKKAILIMNKAGLVQLSKDMYTNKRTFKEAWSVK